MLQEIPDQDTVLELLRILHPDDGGFITFHAKKGENPFAQITALRPRDLGGLFPVAIKDLLEDAYYSINGMRGEWRNARLVVNLNAVWLDCDYHDRPDPYGAAKVGLAKMLALDVMDEIPHPTLYVESGRGFWVFWRLRDENGNRLDADKTNRLSWARLGRHVADCVRAHGFPVDGNALGVERLTRMPESINSLAQQKVVYRISAGTDGKPISYTLPALVRLFNAPDEPALTPKQQQLALPAPSYTPRTGPRGKYSLRAASGWKALRERRLRDLETLMELRGGKFRQGCREYATYLYAILLRGAPDSEIRVRNFARDRCSPPLENSGIRAALKYFKQRPRNLSDVKIGSWLSITPAEAEMLVGGLAYVTPRTIQPPINKLKPDDRRSIINTLCSSGAPSLRKLRASLRDHDCVVSHETIARDLKVLGILNPRESWSTKPLPLFPKLPGTDRTVEHAP